MVNNKHNINSYSNRSTSKRWMTFSTGWNEKSKYSTSFPWTNRWVRSRFYVHMLATKSIIRLSAAVVFQNVGFLSLSVAILSKRENG